jgi:hypothetical protein
MVEEVSRTVVVSYDNDSQRKRAEYQMDEKSDNFDTYEGLVRRFEGSEEEFQERYQTLVEKVGEENLRVETADEVDMGELEVSTELSYDLGIEEGSVTGFLNYWFNSQAPGGEKTGENSFDLYSKKFGSAQVEYETESTEDGTSVRTEWQAGSEEALAGFTELFEDELDQFEASQA